MSRSNGTKAKTWVLTAALFLVCGVLFGCAPKPSYAGCPDPAFVARLKEEALALAESEIAKFNAADQLYKDKLEFHEIRGHPFMSNAGIYTKMYRDFYNYELVDIYRSESFLWPITYEIRYDYKAYSTEMRHSDFPESKELAKKDTEYTLRYETSVTRRYRCDQDGEYDGSLPEVVPHDSVLTPGVYETSAAAPLANPLSAGSAPGSGAAAPFPAPPPTPIRAVD